MACVSSWQCLFFRLPSYPPMIPHSTSPPLSLSARRPPSHHRHHACCSPVESSSRFGAGWWVSCPAPGGSEVPLMAMDARPKLLRYQTLNPGVGSGRDANAWPYLPTLLPRFAGHSSGCLIVYRSPCVCGVSRRSHVLFAAYHKARPSRAIN